MSAGDAALAARNHFVPGSRACKWTIHDQRKQRAAGEIGLLSLGGSLRDLGRQELVDVAGAVVVPTRLADQAQWANTEARWRASPRCGTSTSGTPASTLRRASIDSRQLCPRKQMRRFETTVAKARTKDSIRALAKLCRTVDGELRIVGSPPIVTPIEDVMPGAEQDHLEDVVRRMIRTYRRTLAHDRRHLLESYRYVHAARKVVGVGSVGTRAWILLMVGRDDTDPLFLQFKEAQASVLEPFLGKSRYAQHGQRVVEGQRMMQAAPDIMLGWERIITIDGQQRDFYIRQLWDAKGSTEIELLDPPGLAAYAEICGWTLHAGPRALGRPRRDRGLSRRRRLLRPRDGVVRRDLRRPERSGLPRAAGRNGDWPRRGRDGRLSAALGA